MENNTSLNSSPRHKNDQEPDRGQWVNPQRLASSVHKNTAKAKE